MPASLEMMDQMMVEAVEAAFHFGSRLTLGQYLSLNSMGPRQAWTIRSAR